MTLAEVINKLRNHFGDDLVQVDLSSSSPDFVAVWVSRRYPGGSRNIPLAIPDEGMDDERVDLLIDVVETKFKNANPSS